MRLHITLDGELVAELGRRAGARRRSAFIAHSIRRALEDDQRWDEIEAALDTPVRSRYGPVISSGAAGAQGATG